MTSSFIKTTLHPNNLHADSYNFEELCAKVPLLEKFLVMNKNNIQSIDFTNAEAVVLLNKALLLCYYKIDYWELPKENLCPPIPGRADYIHYINDLLRNDKNTSNKVIGIDIGTGASLIYPILGNSIYNWKFIASDISEKSLENAKKIITNNKKLGDNIKLKHQINRNFILKGIIDENEYYNFVMCNPPFYKSSKEAEVQNKRRNNNLKKVLKSRNFAGNSNELWCKGGELSFVSNYITESILFKKQVSWFTTLLSNKENVLPLKNLLIKNNFSEIKEIEMAQGNKISRILAWKF